MATQGKNRKKIVRRRSLPISSSTRKSKKNLNMKKSASFANSRYPLQEEMELTSGDHLCSGITLAGGARKKSDSLHSFMINPEESISSAIKVMLQPYTKNPQTSLEGINKKVSQIYDIVGKAVADMVENVTVQQSPKGAKPTELMIRVAEHPAEVTVKPINEENLQGNLSPPVSPTPGTIGIEKQSSVETNISAPQSASSECSGSSKRPDSVETNKSAPQSASSQHSISSGSSSSSKRPDSVKTDDSAPHSASNHRSIQSPGDKCYSSIITDNTNESIPAKKTSVGSPQKASCTSVNETDLEVVCGCQLSPLIHNNELYVPVQTSTTGNDMLKSYNLVDGQENNPQEVKRTVSYAGCKMLYLKNIALLITSSSTTKLGLYQLDTKTLPASWEVTSRISVPLLDPQNSIPVPYKDDGVIVVTVINQKPTSQIKFHIFSSKADKRKSVTSHLQSNAKYQIYSCVILLNCIYCGLILPKEGAYIYKFDIASLRKEAKEDEIIPPNCIWTIKNSTLQSCFLSVLKGVIFIVLILTNDNKSIAEIKRVLDHPKISSVECQFEFPCVVKVVAASVIPGIQNPLIAVMYHNDGTGRCFVKRVALSSV